MLRQLQERKAVSMTKAGILIVEDEHIVAWDLQRQLTRLGYTVLGVVSSGEEAIAQTLQLRPDLVLMDIRLPGEMDGVEAAEHIRALVPVAMIFMTAYGDDGTLQRALASGPVVVLRKPFQNAALQSALARALGDVEG
jgi:CheY-like chemotaxis protein